MEELIKGLRVGNVFCLLHVGNMPDERCATRRKLFAEKVMPHLRNMWPDWNEQRRPLLDPPDGRARVPLTGCGGMKIRVHHAASLAGSRIARPSSAGSAC